MKTRKISDYPALTIIEDLVFKTRYIKLGPDTWVIVDNPNYPNGKTHVYSYTDKSVANLTGGNFNVYKPCGHGGKIRVGGTA